MRAMAERVAFVMVFVPRGTALNRDRPAQRPAYEQCRLARMRETLELP